MNNQKKKNVRKRGRPAKRKEKKPALRKAIEITGGIVNLSMDIGTTYPNVSRWLYSNLKIPAHHVPAIVRATKGKVTAKELRPDIDWDMPKGE